MVAEGGGGDGRGSSSREAPGGACMPHRYPWFTDDMMYPFPRHDFFSDTFWRPRRPQNYFEYGPFSDPFFFDRGFQDWPSRHGFHPYQYPARPNMFDYMNHQMDMMMNHPFAPQFANSKSAAAIPAPSKPQAGYELRPTGMNWNWTPQERGASIEQQASATTAQAHPPQGKWVCEVMEGVWDGDTEPVMRKTRSSYDTNNGIFKRESQKKIGDKTLNVVKTKKVAHPSELANDMPWDTETRSLPKNDPFKAEWKQAKKKLTAGGSNDQNPPSTTHKALFNNMVNPALPPKDSP